MIHKNLSRNKNNIIPDIHNDEAILAEKNQIKAEDNLALLNYRYGHVAEPWALPQSAADYNYPPAVQIPWPDSRQWRTHTGSCRRLKVLVIQT